MENIKICSKCKLKKDLSCFYFSKTIYSSYCKICIRERENKKRHYTIPFDLNNEKWENIFQNEGVYMISNLGRVKSFATREYGKILKQRISSAGYVIYSLRGYSSSKKAHRLVAQAFIPNPENKPQVNHINGIKTDNRVENLEWCTSLENAKHAWETNLITSNKGDSHGQSKLTENQVLEIRKEYETLKTKKEASLYLLKTKEKYSVSIETIRNIIKRRTWNHV